MNELMERMVKAERAVAAEVSADGVADAILPTIGRRRAARSAAAVLASAVVAVGVGAVAMAILESQTHPSPALPPSLSVETKVTDAESMSTYDVGQKPSTPVPRREWDLIDDRWAMAVWAPVNAAWKNSFALDYPLLLVAPDGRSWTAATVKRTIAPQILAWDPEAQTALVTSGATDAPEDANLGIISLDGGEDSFTAECLEGTPASNAERYAGAVDGGYVVHNGCGEEYFTTDGAFRTEPTATQFAALWDAKYPRSGVSQVVLRDNSIMVGNTEYFIDTDGCTPLVRPRMYQSGYGCAVDGGFEINAGEIAVTVESLPGVESQPSITKLCGAGTAHGTLSDGSVGVGVVRDPYVLPLVLNGSPATDCRDGRYTWYVSGGGLYFSVIDDEATRVIRVNSALEDLPEGAGVIDVAPAPFDDSAN